VTKKRLSTVNKEEFQLMTTYFPLGNMREVNISYSNIEYLQPLLQMKKLQKITCSNASPEHLKYFGAIPTLTALFISRSRYVRDEDLLALRALPQLTSLHLTGCRKITSKGVK